MPWAEGAKFINGQTLLTKLMNFKSQNFKNLKDWNLVKYQLEKHIVLGSRNDSILETWMETDHFPSEPTIVLCKTIEAWQGTQLFRNSITRW